MMHPLRPHFIQDVIDVEVLADWLVNRTWTTCTGFRWGNLILLNDATSEDGAQEYTVVKDGRQVDTLTCSWMTVDVCRQVLQNLDTGMFGTDMGAVHIIPHPDGCCFRCA